MQDPALARPAGYEEVPGTGDLAGKGGGPRTCGQHLCDQLLVAERPRRASAELVRLVARYADACNLPDIPDGGRTVKRKLAVLAGHCADVGRPYEAIEKTLGTRLEAGESSDGFVRRAVAAAELGIEHLGVITAGAWRPEALAAAIRQLREVRPPQTPSTAP